MTARALVSLTLGVTLALAAPCLEGRAQDEATVDREAEFQAQLDAGLAHYEERRYAEAAAAFEAAYAIRAEPELAYNIARSYERAVMREEEIAAYDRFLGLPGTTSEMRNRARSARSSLRAEVEALARPEVPDEPELAPEPIVEPVVEAPSEPAAPVEPASESALVPVGWILVATGGLGVGGGAVFGGLALAANGDFDAATDRSEQVRLRDEVRRFALLTDILVGVGAGVAVGGVILVLIGLSEGGGGDDAAVTWAPRVGPDELGLSAVGRF